MDQSHPKIILVAGPNGAGKSTNAPALLRDTFGIMEFVNADTVARGLSTFQPERVALEAGRATLKRLQGLAAQRVSFAFESTLAGRAYAVWLAGLQQRGYDFHLFFIWLPSPDLAIQRVRERVRHGGHDIPEEVIRRRYQAGRRNFFSLYRPLTTTWQVYDNSESTGPVLLAQGAGNDVRIVYRADLWQGFLEREG